MLISLLFILTSTEPQGIKWKQYVLCCWNAVNHDIAINLICGNVWLIQTLSAHVKINVFTVWNRTEQQIHWEKQVGGKKKEKILSDDLDYKNH